MAVRWKSTVTVSTVATFPTYIAKSRLATSHATAPKADATSAAWVSMRRTDAYL